MISTHDRIGLITAVSHIATFFFVDVIDTMDLLDNKENRESLIMIKGKSFMRTFHVTRRSDVRPSRKDEFN